MDRVSFIELPTVLEHLHHYVIRLCMKYSGASIYDSIKGTTHAALSIENTTLYSAALISSISPRALLDLVQHPHLLSNHNIPEKIQSTKQLTTFAAGSTTTQFSKIILHVQYHTNHSCKACLITCRTAILKTCRTCQLIMTISSQKWLKVCYPTVFSSSVTAQNPRTPCSDVYPVNKEFKK